MTLVGRKKKQDFTLNNIALEAKTTLSENNSRIKISSLEQLERITSELYLVHIFLNKTNDEQSWTLERLNLAILEAIKDDVILKSSYFRKFLSFYNKATLEQLQLKFNFVDKNIYTVVDSFPGIVASEELHPALVKASYELDTNKLSEYKIDKSLNEIQKMVELKTYSEELFNRILYATESNSTFSEEEFNLTSELLGEAGVLDDIEYHPFKNKRKGLRMDGFSYNELERSINIIVIKYTNLSEPK